MFKTFKVIMESIYMIICIISTRFYDTNNNDIFFNLHINILFISFCICTLWTCKIDNERTHIITIYDSMFLQRSLLYWKNIKDYIKVLKNRPSLKKSIGAIITIAGSIPGINKKVFPI